MTDLDLKKIIYKRLRIPDKDENIERLTQEQMEFISQDINNPTYLEACPGSGKTEVVGLKAAFELIDWTKKFNGIAILSFTNNAASEIKNRALKYAGIKAISHPHFIGTIDSWLYNYFFLPSIPNLVGYLGLNDDKSPKSIIDDNSDADFLCGFTCPTPFPYYDSTSHLLRTHPITVNKYIYDVCQKEYYIKHPFSNEFISVNTILNSPAFIEYCQDKQWLTRNKFVEGLNSTKRKFWKSGFYTYNDVELLCYLLLNKKPEISKLVAKRFNYIFIDECQDLSSSQINFFQILIANGCKVFFVGDIKQSIFSFRRVNPDYLIQFIKFNGISRQSLSRNFRSNQHIVDLCSKIILPTFAIKGNDSLYSPSCIFWEYNDGDIQDISSKFKTFIININKGSPVISLNNCAIVGRAWGDLTKLRSHKYNSNNIYECLAYAFICWNKKEKSTNDLISAILCTGQFFSKTYLANKGSKVNYYCPESYSPISWRTYLGNFLNKYSHLYDPIPTQVNSYTWSQWAKKVKVMISETFKNLPTAALLDLDSILRKQVTKGKGNECISITFKDAGFQNLIRTTTIHSIKGETLDAVLLLSSKTRKSNGGHFEQWFNQSPKTEDDNEYIRFGYVACSRPKHLLILAVPKLTLDQKKTLESLGFSPE